MLVTGTMKMKNMGKTILLLTLFISSVTIYACSSARNEETADSINLDDNDGKRTLIFHEDGVEWEVKFEDNEITSLSKDGINVPEGEIPKYKNFIKSKVREIDRSMRELQAKMDNFDMDMERFHSDMDRVHQNLYNISFDKEDFQKSMEEADLQIKQAFNSDEFQQSMKDLQENLKDIKVEVNLDELHKELQNLNVHVDLSNLNEQMENVKAELKNLKFNYKEKGLRKYNRFMNDLKEELVNDGFIYNSEEDFDMDFNSREMRINGEKIPDEYHKKYKELYEKRFDMKMDDDMNIRTNE